MEKNLPLTENLLPSCTISERTPSPPLFIPHMCPTLIDYWKKVNTPSTLPSSFSKSYILFPSLIIKPVPYAGDGFTKLHTETKSPIKIWFHGPPPHPTYWHLKNKKKGRNPYFSYIKTVFFVFPPQNPNDRPSNQLRIPVPTPFFNSRN